MSDFQFYAAMFSVKMASTSIQFQAPPLAPERPNYIYHYTTAEGLKGIVEGNTLWATGVYYLNDTSEIEYGCQLATDVLKGNLDSAETKFLMAVLQRALFVLSDSAQRKIRMATYYVACFCEDDNLLSQWRAYGRSGGFALGFRTAEYGRLRPDPMIILLRRVVYEKSAQIKLLGDLAVSSMGVLRDDDVVRGDANSPSTESVVEAGNAVAQTFLSFITCFKAPDFAEEREWRLVCQPFLADDNEKLAGVGKIVRFRGSSRGLIPYIHLECNPTANRSSTLPIDSVRFGPTQTPDLAQNVTRMLLDAHGFQTVQVDGSNIPVII